MKIRTDFVTNSSSTSFVIISREELTQERFLEFMGLDEGSCFAGIFKGLYHSLGLHQPPGDQTRNERIEQGLLPHVQKKIEEARANGHKVFIGEMSSDEDSIESFFCTDSFEVEEDGFFFSALENYW